MTVASYNVGDTIYVAQRLGWSGHSVTEWTVERLTPSGIAVARLHDAEIRVNPNGRIVGEGAYGRRSIVTAERADMIRKEAVVRTRWVALSNAASALESAARHRDTEAADKHFTECAKLLASLQEQTP